MRCCTDYIYRNWVLVVATSVLSTLTFYRMITLSILPDELLIRVVPDDAFYYMVLAKNYLTTHLWSFDNINPSSGFHLMYGYFLSGIYNIFGVMSFNDLFIFMGSINITMYVVSFYLISSLLVSKTNQFSVVGVLAVYMSPTSILNTTYLMESVFPIFFGSLVLFLIFHAKNHSIQNFFFIFIFSFLGELSRTDFGATVLILFLILSISSSYKRGSFHLFIPACVALIGAALGLTVVFAHNMYMFGHFIQTSALVKSYWSTVHGYNMLPILWLIKNAYFLPFIIGFCLVSLGILTDKKVFWKVTALLPIFVSSAVIILFYILFYGKNSGAIQPWYIGNIHVYFAIIVGIFFSMAFYLYDLLKILTLLCIGYFSFKGYESIGNQPWKHQSAMMIAGKEIKNINGKIGSWNSGIISWYSRKDIINLDGLVNDNIFSYLRKQNLLSFIIDSNIKYIVDFKNMITADILKKRGGYACSGLESSLILDKEFIYFEKWGASNIALFMVTSDIKDECLLKVREPNYFNDDNVIFDGWSHAEPTLLWSLGNSSQISFNINDLRYIDGVLKFNFGTLGKQEI